MGGWFSFVLSFFLLVQDLTRLLCGLFGLFSCIAYRNLPSRIVHDQLVDRGFYHVWQS